MEIQFYHLLTSPLEVALPKLMAKVVSAGLRTVITCRDAAQQSLLDEKLWTADPDHFLAHGIAGAGKEADQPILLSLDTTNLNAAGLLLILNGTQLQPSEMEGYTRLADMFDGADEASVLAARTRWKAYKEAGHTLTYYKQQPSGGWKQEA